MPVYSKTQLQKLIAATIAIWLILSASIGLAIAWRATYPIITIALLGVCAGYATASTLGYKDGYEMEQKALAAQSESQTPPL